VRQDVEFEGHGGTLLRGWLYLPGGVANAPGVVMAHGLSAVKEMGLDRYAEVFCQAGLAVLVYDHRNLGASDGLPRQEINPWAQARDYLHAISWLCERPETDADRIAVWGSSYSGGEAIVVGACNDRVKAVVANVPFTGYADLDYTDTAAHCQAICREVRDESDHGLADREGLSLGPLPVIRMSGDPPETPVMLDQPESHEWFGEQGAGAPSWRNSVTLKNAMGTDPAWDPGACVAHVSPTPLLLVVASEDRLAETSISVAAYERAGEPKELAMVDGHHFIAYDGPGFECSAQAAKSFLVRHLKGE
jgi:cephalosporin-C deacetylase-like acetyl esterase